MGQRSASGREAGFLIGEPGYQILPGRSKRTHVTQIS
jgi:hypothetical protein